MENITELLSEIIKKLNKPPQLWRSKRNTLIIKLDIYSAPLQLFKNHGSGPFILNKSGHNFLLIQTVHI